MNAYVGDSVLQIVSWIAISAVYIRQFFS